MLRTNAIPRVLVVRCQVGFVRCLSTFVIAPIRIASEGALVTDLRANGYNLNIANLPDNIKVHANALTGFISQERNE